MKQLQINKYFVVLLAILFVTFWIWWLPGPRAANDFSYVSNDWLNSQFDLPRVWTERGASGLGEYGTFLVGSWPVAVVFGLFANIGMNFEIWERILILLFILLGSFSIWKLLGSYSLSAESKFIGSLFYLINTYSILLIDGGQIFIAIVYGLFPLAFLSLSNAVHANLIKKIIAGLLIAVVGVFDVRFIYLLFVLFLLKVIFEILFTRREHLSKKALELFSTVLIAGVIILGVNYTWLMIQFKAPLDELTFSSLTKLSENFVNIGHAFLVIAPHWPQNIFGKISHLRFEFILIPILVFLAPVLKRRDKDIVFWLLVALVAIFLGKDGSQPLSEIYPWLHSNIPGFSFFRDSTKFFFLLTLSYSILIAKTSEYFITIKKRFMLPLGKIYLLFVTIYFLFLIRPVLLNQMTGTMSLQPSTAEFQSLAGVLEEDQSFGRVFWIPSTFPLTYYDLNHPVVEAIRIFNKKPFAYGVKGAYEIFNFLREASYTGELFDVAGISYIAYPYPDTRRNQLSPDDVKYYSTFLNQITNLPWIKGNVKESKIPLLKTNNHQERIFSTANTWLVFGSDEVFNESTKSAELRLSNNAIIFAENKPGIVNQFIDYPEIKVVLNSKTNTDLVASLIPQSKLIFPAKFLSATPNESGWWKNDGSNLIYWRDFLQTKYGIDNKDFDLGGGWAVGEGELGLEINGDPFKAKDILFARVLESSKSGELIFYQGNKLIGAIDTKIESDTNIRWFEVGELTRSVNLSVKTKGEINVINSLVSIPQKDLEIYRKKAAELSTRITGYAPENTSSGSATVSYTKLNQTMYKVKISNLIYPSMIIFSSTFHPLWKLDNQYSTPMYGFLNGFRVDKNGEYLLYFEPQKYVKEGLVVTASVLLFALGGLIYLKYFTHGSR